MSDQDSDHVGAQPLAAFENEPGSTHGTSAPLATGAAPSTLDVDLWCREHNPLTAFASDPPPAPRTFDEPVIFHGVRPPRQDQIGPPAVSAAVRKSTAVPERSAALAWNRAAPFRRAVALASLVLVAAVTLATLNFARLGMIAGGAARQVASPPATVPAAPLASTGQISASPDQAVAQRARPEPERVVVPALAPVRAPVTASAPSEREKRSPVAAAAPSREQQVNRPAPTTGSLAASSPQATPAPRTLSVSPPPAVTDTRQPFSADTSTAPDVPRPASSAAASAPPVVPATPAAPPLTSAPADAVLAVALAAPSAATPPPAAAAAPRVAIQSALSRYAAALSALDARGAKAVWPSVNERGLARAFSSLQEQQVDLGDCSIWVSGQSAVAACEGTTRYTPKVGNRSVRSEPRQWTFHLQQNGSEWSIDSVNSR